MGDGSGFKQREKRGGVVILFLYVLIFSNFNDNESRYE